MNFYIHSKTAMSNTLRKVDWCKYQPPPDAQALKQLRPLAQVPPVPKGPPQLEF